jgi:multidrug efflux pump subunit AcrA (membrane-fusion protein)
MAAALVDAGGREVMTRQAIVLCLFSVVGCGSHEPAAPPPPAPRSSVSTPWVPARPPESASLLEMPAQVESAPQSTGAVTPPYPARVARILTRPGEHVTRGAPIVEVVMPQLVTAAGAFGSARTRVDAYTKRRAQLEALRAEGLARVAEISEVETRLAEARADQQSALATLRAAGISPEEASRILANGGTTMLRSPVDGTVTELQAVIGETRDAGGKPVARIVGAGAPRIAARVSHGLPPGARFELILAGRTPTPLRLVSQAPVVDPRDGTTPSWFEPTAEALLPGGASGRLRILLPEAASVVVVPATAAVTERGQLFVVVKSGDGSRRVPVRVLASSGADALVEGALKTGDPVAADGRAMLTDGGAR